jgi:hypothetical protein
MILIAAVGVFTTAMLYAGLAGLLGGLRMVRCRSCDHWTTCVTDSPGSSCPHCRHPVLLHPVHAIGSLRSSTSS